VNPIRFGPGGEFRRIGRILDGMAALPAGVRVGPGDDAAVLEPDLVVSTDLMVEEVHFRRGWLSMPELGRRAVAAAVSDLAAMAASLQGILASVAVPGSGGEAEEVMAGARVEVESLGGVLLGGDLARSPGPVFVDVVAVGRARIPLLRSGAREGDELWITGLVGGAAGAVTVWERGEVPTPGLRRAFAAPTPRLEPARWLVREASARAAIDLSDGLAGDAGHLAAASGVRVVLDGEEIPVHPELPRGREGLELALHGGEDYELLVAVPKGSLTPFRVEEFRGTFDLSLSRVGRVERGEGVLLVPPGEGDPIPLTRGGHDHFRDEEMGEL
jgi:thiamine-monophosphate kinase